MIETILEIIKVTVPALIVFLTVYFLQKAHYKNALTQYTIESRKNKEDRLLPQKIQAYERLSLLCNRIRIPQLIMRLRTEDTQAQALAIAMNIAIQHEMSHNATQQLYVSHNLWDIIKLASEQTQEIINSASAAVSPDASMDELIDKIMEVSSELEYSPLDRALYAINEEIKLLS